MRVAIDTGGTFTDCLFLRDGRIEILKVPSTRGNPTKAIANALEKILAGASAVDCRELDLLCGTTVGTNALLERRGGRVALVTTAGFEDVLEIGRQARPSLYDFFVERPEPLVPRERRFGVRERVGADGRVVARLSPAEVANVVRRVRASRADSVAVCLLFSFLRPEHERLLARSLRRAGYAVSVSYEILPEFREFERTSTTVVNAYLAPVMSRYLEEVERDSRRAVAAKNQTGGRPGLARVRVMQSSGGILSARVAAREPVRTVLSGPAGGVLGAGQVARDAGYERVISFDMGGTSTDVSLIEGTLRTSNESTIAGLPVAVPMLEIHTVGAGGGSIARFDRAGALRVGPESAGADPGPICYGRGELPTVTDAHLVLGRLGSEGLLGGDFVLDERADAHLHATRDPTAARRALRGAICAGDTRRGRGNYGEGDSRDLDRARPRPARLHLGCVWRSGRAARLHACREPLDSARSDSQVSGSPFGAGDSAGRRGEGFVADGAAAGRVSSGCKAITSSGVCAA